MKYAMSLMPLEAHRLLDWLQKRDCEVAAHCLRTAFLAAALGRQMGVSEGQAWLLEVGASLHDLGKGLLSCDLIHKSERLSASEWKTMRSHPGTGAEIARRAGLSADLCAVIALHHERWDGKGYPVGVRGAAIPLEARIVAVADAFDAMTSNREYQRKLTVDEAIGEMICCARHQFCPRVVDALVALFESPFDAAGAEEITMRWDLRCS